MPLASPSPASIVSKQGTLAEVSGGGTLTINGNFAIDIQSRGAIECKVGTNKKGGNLNIFEVKELKCKNGPLIKATDSNIAVSSVGTLKAQNGSILDLVSDTRATSVILSDVGVLSSSFSSVNTRGNSKVLINNVESILCSDPVFVNASASSTTSVLGGGSITLKNIKSIPNTIRVYDHNLTINNVKSIVSNNGTGIDFNTSVPNKTGVYKLDVSSTGAVKGLTYAITTKSSVVNIDGVQFVGGCLLTNSDVRATGCSFGGDLDIKDSFFEGRRVTTLKVDVSDSSARFYNSVISGEFTTLNSAVDTHTSTLVENTHDTSSVTLFNSKSSGVTTVNSGSSLISSSSLLSTIHNNGGHVGVYGRASGSVTTSGSGMTFSGGSSGQVVDGYPLDNGISAPGAVLSFISSEFHVESSGDIILNSGGIFELNVTGSITQTGTTVTWIQSGAIDITSSSTVTITGTSVVV